MAGIGETASTWAPRILSVLRIVTGLLFIEHGTMKFFNFPPSDMFADLQILSLFGIQGILELVGGALIILGLFTRPAAFILSGDMAAAYFIAHMPNSFFPAINQGDAAILFCFIFLYFAFAGAGPWSVDAARGKA
ncbi:MAG TPA: DoxX family protein [Dongiaceae bacterium]|nr:DoxX family protein [Dongiaceae bacterium]